MIYMRIIYTCFSYWYIYFVRILTPCRCLCGVYWAFQYTEMMTIPLLYFLCNFFNMLSQLLKRYKVFQKKGGINFCAWLSNRILRNLFLQFTYPEQFFEDQFRAKITKISSVIIYSTTIYNHKNFCS